MTRMSRIAPVLAGAVALFVSACADEPPTAPVTPSPAVAAAVVKGPGARAQAGRYIVRLRRSAFSTSRMRAGMTAMGGTVERSLPQVGVLVVRDLAAKDASRMARQPDVLAVVPDYTMQWIPRFDAATMQRRALPSRIRSAPKASGTNQSGAFFFPVQWNLRVTHADAAWDVTPGGANTLVCVLDSGVDPGQVDLLGRVDLSKSASFIPTEPFIEDVNGHGTFVSSLIASNGVGVASFAPDAVLCAAKVLDLTGSGPFSGVIEGMLHAVDVGADVMNLSLSAYVSRDLPGVDALIAILSDVVEFASAHGTLTVAAAGNDGADLDHDGSLVVLPAEVPGVLSIAATAPFRQHDFDRLTSYTNFGSEKGGVDMSAPGGDLLKDGLVEDLIFGACSRYVCGADGFYLAGGGTSFASPEVAAAAAVAQSNLPGDQRAVELMVCVKRNADEDLLGERIVDARYGAGRLNVLLAAHCENSFNQR